MNIFEQTGQGWENNTDNFYPEHEKDEIGVEARVAEAKEKLDGIFNSVPVEEFIELDEEVVDRLLDESLQDLKERLDKARGKNELTN